MKTEIEVKFLDVDFNLLREKLTQLGAVCEQPMRLMRRVIIEPPELEARHAFIRIRDEGDKITLTYKQFQERSLTGAKEIEVNVSNFDDTIALFDQLGLIHKSFQETKRETWHLGDVEIMLDEWPWLKPFIEIEGVSEQAVKDVAAQLGYEWNTAIFGSAVAAYEIEYPHGDPRQLVNIPRVAFDEPIPAVFIGPKKDINA